MNKREFLKRLFTGVCAAALAPTLLTETEPPLIPFEHFEKVFPKQKFGVSFKITTEALGDEQAFNEIVSQEIEWWRGKFVSPTGGPLEFPDKIEVGTADDDFCKDMKTVLLTWYYV